MPNNILPEDVYKVLDPVLYRLYVMNQSPSNVAKDLGHSYIFTSRLKNWLTWQRHKQNLDSRFFDKNLSKQFGIQFKV
ncbi:MAG: hypothetical protein QW156_02055 [Candidatus Aenigmatarchaeota archaeon]